jgi:hypothetical protein
VTGVHKILAHGVPEEIDFVIFVTFVGSKVSQFLMCVAQDLIPDIETITMSSKGNVDEISISFPVLIENSNQDLLLAFIFSITGPLNCMVRQLVLCCSFPNGIMTRSFHMVLKLIHMKVHSLVPGVLEGVVDIDRVHELYN